MSKSKTIPPKKKVMGGPSTQIKAATKEQLKDNQEFLKSYSSVYPNRADQKAEGQHRSMYAYMDGENRKYRARKNEMQPGVSVKVQEAFNAVGKNSPQRISDAEVTAAREKHKNAASKIPYGDVYTGPPDQHPGVLKARADKAKRDSVVRAYSKSIKKK